MILDDFECQYCGLILEKDIKSRDPHICPHCNEEMEKVFLVRQKGGVVWDGKRV